MDARVFPIGSNWGGFLPREEWDNDFFEMRKAGLNAARIEVRFPGSRWPAETYWDLADRMFDLARDHDIGLLVSLITIIIPPEFFVKYPDIRFIDIDGQPFPRSIEDLTWPQACFNHPGYRAEIEKLFGDVIPRYVDRTNVLAWTVHNEPCNPWGGTGCYCPHTIEVFRGWLRERYAGDLNQVNRLWGTTFGSWAGVQPPRTQPKEGGNATAWIDWMCFGEWNVTDFIRWEAGLVRDLDPSRAVGTNTMGGMLRPITTAQSEKELAKVLDFIGLDWYPSWVLGRRHGQTAQMEKHVPAKLDMTRWAVGDKRAIVMEVQAGPNAESIWFGADEMRIAGWQAVAHGMKGIYYYRWDPLVSGLEPWVHHMRTIEGQVTERVDEAGRLAREIGHIVDLIDQSQPVQAPVALFYSRPSKIMAQADGLFDPQYGQAVQGTYRLFVDNHYAVDWIDVDDLAAGKLADYKVLLLPFTYCLDSEVAEAIKSFVREGGIVLAEPFCATRDERGVPYGEAPGAGLAELFGCRATGTVNYHYWLVAHALEMTPQGAAITGIKEDAKFWFCGLRETVELTGEQRSSAGRVYRLSTDAGPQPGGGRKRFWRGQGRLLCGGTGRGLCQDGDALPAADDRRADALVGCGQVGRGGGPFGRGVARPRDHSLGCRGGRRPHSRGHQPRGRGGERDVPHPGPTAWPAAGQGTDPLFLAGQFHRRGSDRPGCSCTGKRCRRIQHLPACEPRDIDGPDKTAPEIGSRPPCQRLLRRWAASLRDRSGL